MPMYSTNRAKPNNPAGTDSTTKDRGQTSYGSMRDMPNKARVDAPMVDMTNIEGMHSRRAPKSDVLR